MSKNTDLIKNEKKLLQEALRVGLVYMKNRGVTEQNLIASGDTKTRALYNLLVHDKLIHPLAKHNISEQAIKRKLVFWIARTLPADHPLQQDS